VELLGSGLSERLDQALEALELLIDDEPRGRRRLMELRASSSYEDAYSEPSPLVSIIIPTWNRTHELTTRAIPSVLSQTHENVEVVVVGDASPPGLAAAVEAIDDPRVSFHNLTVRGPYDADPIRAWCASGTPPMNAGLARARGHWISCIGDDDELPPTHVERLLAFARAKRLEFACGRFRHTGPDGEVQMVGSFPPKLGATGLQISLWHGGLRFLQFELAHALFGTPNDWGLIRRMMRIGVTMGQADDVIVPYTPSGRGRGFGAAAHDERPQLRREIIQLRDRIDVLETERAHFAESLGAAERQSGLLAAELDRRLHEVASSKSWRITAPLRKATALNRRLHQMRR
jgi:glycosyl transferase family 2